MTEAAVTLEQVRDQFERIKVGWFVASKKNQQEYLRTLLLLERPLNRLNETADPLLRLEIRDLKLQIAERLGM